MRGSLAEYTRIYHSTKEWNDILWKLFTQATDANPLLKEHRDWVERNNWGFGDRAFHYLWYLLLSEDVLHRPAPSVLEIGIYKGQVISLWARIAQESETRLRIVGISPFGSTEVLPEHAHMDTYPDLDYRACVKTIFEQFQISQADVELIRGRSQDEAVQSQVKDRLFDLVYIDGEHRYEAVVSDVAFYGARVRPGGYLVLDDASVFQPGGAFWKGHASVSRAAEEIDTRMFTNILNVGHNRVYRRTGV